MLEAGIGALLFVCSQIAFLSGAIASEGARQPFEAQVDIARAARNVLCDYGAENYLAGLRVANQAMREGRYDNHHFRAYYRQWTFSAALRERWEAAALIALTEDPPKQVSHFIDRFHNPEWWARACKREWEIGDHKFCSGSEDP